MRIQKLSCAGKLWDEDDFKSMKMDEHCKEIEDTLEVMGIQKGRIRVVKIWVEGWEKKVLGPSDDEIFEARLVRKYGGLKQFDPDENAKFVAHSNKMHFEKKRMNNQYMILVIKDGFDLDYEENHVSNVDLLEPWNLSDDFFNRSHCNIRIWPMCCVIQRNQMFAKAMKSKLVGVVVMIVISFNNGLLIVHFDETVPTPTPMSNTTGHSPDCHA